MTPGTEVAAAAEAFDAGAVVAALQARGLHRSDPPRFSYLQVLAARTDTAAEPLRALLQQRLLAALQAYEAQAAQALPGAQQAGAARLQARAAAPGPLAALVRDLGVDPGAVPTPGSAPAPAELRALQRARGTWARLRVQHQIHGALASAPDNPGPLNSHRLVLRSLQRLQQLSPAYLERLVVHAETLLWLDQAQFHSGAKTLPAAPPGQPRRPRTRAQR